MSGISTNKPHAILDARNAGITLMCYGTRLELAEAAAYQVWSDLGGPENHVKWLRDLADKFAAQHKVDSEPSDED